MINLDRLFFGPASNLSNIPRFSIYARTRNESVAEHSYYVVMYCIFICDLLQIDWDDSCGPAEDDPNVDLASVLVTAVFHDFGEAFYGDLNGPFKSQMNIDWQKGLKLREYAMLDIELNKLEISNSTSIVYDDERVKFIVYVADMMSLIGFISRERMAGNQLIMEQINSDEIDHKLENLRLRCGEVFSSHARGKEIVALIEELETWVAAF